MALWVGLLVGGVASAWFAGGAIARAEGRAAVAAPQELDDERGEAHSPADSLAITPLPQTVSTSSARARLGEQLFHDARLSRDGTVSCASCHPLDRAGVDGSAHSFGVARLPTAVNTPTVFNCGFNLRYNWNGAYDTLARELDAPIQRAMGTTWAAVVSTVRSIPAYQSAFAANYADGITEENIRGAIVEFERGLVTPNSRFDRYLAGDHGTLSSDEVDGWRLFREYGCSSCHQGVNAGGNMFQRMGVMGDYFADRGAETRADLGLEASSGRAEDRHIFRVPSLRNVERTAPYLHDGRAATIEAAIDTMARYQLGRSIPVEDVQKIAAFLRTLTGSFRGRPL